MQTMKRKLLLLLVMSSSQLLTGCNANVGICMSVGVQLGNNGYVSVGTGMGRWF